MNLPEFVIEHTARGECKCGRCFDVGTRPEPGGHTVDVAFFKVALAWRQQSAAIPDQSKHDVLSEFRRLTAAHSGEFNDCDPFDGQEHGYIELGGWLGDQQVALRYMAMGALIGAFKLLTPRSMLGDDLPDDMVQELAGMGMVTVVAATEAENAVQPIEVDANGTIVNGHLRVAVASSVAEGATMHASVTRDARQPGIPHDLGECRWDGPASRTNR